MAVETNRPGQVVTHDQYVHLLKRSSMVLNFASTFPGRIDPIFSEDAQIKARVLEGMSAGCVVLEKDNLYSRRNFAHMQDIVFYRDLDDALAKIDQLREDPDLLRRIGRNAHATIAARFDSNCFWKHVLTSAGLTGLPTRSPT
jgi:spore maturation protein CgeB